MTVSSRRFSVATLPQQVSTISSQFRCRRNSSHFIILAFKTKAIAHLRVFAGGSIVLSCSWHLYLILRNIIGGTLISINQNVFVPWPFMLNTTHTQGIARLHQMSNVDVNEAHESPIRLGTLNPCACVSRAESLAVAEGRYVTSLNLTECELT